MPEALCTRQPQNVTFLRRVRGRRGSRLRDGRLRFGGLRSGRDGGLVLGVGDAEGDERGVLAEADEASAFAAASVDGDLVDGRADHHAGGGDVDHGLAFADRVGGDDPSVAAVVVFDGDHAAAAAVVRGEPAELGAVAVAVLGGDEEGLGVVDDVEGAHRVTRGEADAAHACGGAAHPADAGFALGAFRVGLLEGDGEADGLAVGGDQQDVVGFADEADLDEAVGGGLLGGVVRVGGVGFFGRVAVVLFALGVLELDGDDAPAVDVREFGEGGAFDDAVFGGEEDVLAGGEGADGEQGDHGLAFAQLKQVDDGLAEGGAGRLGDLVGVFLEDAALAGEEEEGVVGFGDEDAVDEVLVLDHRAGDAPAAAFLLAVGGEGDALDVAALAEGDDAGLVGDEVFDVDLALHGDDVGAAGVAAFGGGDVFGLDVGEVLLDEAVDLGGVFEQALEVGDAFAEFAELGFDFFAFEAGELVEAYLEYGVALLVGEGDVFADAGLGLGADRGRSRVWLPLACLIRRSVRVGGPWPRRGFWRRGWWRRSRRGGRGR